MIWLNGEHFWARPVHNVLHWLPPFVECLANCELALQHIVVACVSVTTGPVRAAFVTGAGYASGELNGRTVVNAMIALHVMVPALA